MVILLGQRIFPVGSTLGALPGTHWLLNRRPAIAFLICLGLSPLFMWLVDVLIVWGRVLPLSYQWLSALFDSALAAGIGLMIWNLRPVHYTDLPRPIQQLLLGSRKFHVLLLLGWLALSVLHTYQERSSVGTWERRLGPNSIYHNLLLFPFLGYVYSLLLIATVSLMFGFTGIHGSILWFFRGWVVALLSIGIAAGWFWAGAQFDAQHQLTPNGVSKHNYSNPPDPWCGGIITVHICGPAKDRALIN